MDKAARIHLPKAAIWWIRYRFIHPTNISHHVDHYTNCFLISDNQEIVILNVTKKCLEEDDETEKRENSHGENETKERENSHGKNER